MARKQLIVDIVDPTREAIIRELISGIKGARLNDKQAAKSGADLGALVPEKPKRRKKGVPLKWEDFNFDKSRELLKDVKVSLSDLVIEERRS